MASKSTHPAASTEELTVVMTLEGHEPRPDDQSYPYRLSPVTISFVPGGEQLISCSGDRAVRRWGLQTGKEINEARFVCEKEVNAVAISRDGRWIITAGTHRIPYDPADVELKIWEVKTGMMKTFKENTLVTCIDISADSTLLAIGSADATVRIWNFETGKLVAGPFQTTEWGGTVRFSQDSMKLAVESGLGKCLEVWDIQGQKLHRRIGKQGAGGLITYAPVFWTTNDKSIVAAFTLTSHLDDPRTIYEFDASTLDIVGVPFQGHTKVVTGLALSLDCALLASASVDHTIKLWAFESRQHLASFHIRYLSALILSPDLRHLAYKAGSEPKIYICNVPPKILTIIRSAQDAQSGTSFSPNTSPLGDLLNSDATRRPAAVHPAPVISFTPLPHRPSPTVHQQQPAFTHLRPGMHSGENSRTAAFTEPSATTIKARLSGWWPTNMGRELPPIVDVNVPLAQGKKRNAAAGAPKGSDDLVLDENFDSRPPSPIPNSQLSSAAGQTNTGAHGSSWSCFCL